MKLIIDINEEVRDWFVNGFLDEEDAVRLLDIVKNGTPLEECEDCVSRQAAIDAIKKLHSIETEYDCTLYEKLDVLYELEDLPPVTPVKKQEPCDDAISRQAVLDMMQMRMGAKELYRAVYDLPPVTPAEKVGRWKRISMDKYVQHAMAYYKCSVCGKDIIGTHNYCPSCGAKMQEEDAEKHESCENPHIYECSCGYGWDKSKVVRHHFCPNCGRKVQEVEE